MAITTTEASDVLANVFTGTLYVSLHVMTPLAAGDTASELVRSENGYRRAKTTFSSAGAGQVSNDSKLIFTGLDKVRVTHVGIWSHAELVHKMLAYGEVTTLAPGENGGVVINAGDLVVSLT